MDKVLKDSEYLGYLARGRMPRDINKVEDIEKIIFLDLEKGIIKRYAIKIRFDWFGEKHTLMKGFNSIDESLQFVNALREKHSMPIIIGGSGGPNAYRNVVNKNLEASDLNIRISRDELYRKLSQYLKNR